MEARVNGALYRPVIGPCKLQADTDSSYTLQRLTPYVQEGVGGGHDQPAPAAGNMNQARTIPAHRMNRRIQLHHKQLRKGRYPGILGFVALGARTM